MKGFILTDNNMSKDQNGKKLIAKVWIPMQFIGFKMTEHLQCI